MLKLILLFTIIPLLELTLLIKLSNYFGIIVTLSLVTFTGIVGATLAKKQGSSVIKKINNHLAQGEMPTDSLVDGLLVLIGGVMLITPGLLTDIGGFSCIIPFTRSKIKVLTKNRLSKLITNSRVQFFTANNKKTKTVDVTDNDEQ